MGRPLTKTTPRLADPARVMADLALMEAAGLRAAVELRGLARHDVANALCEVLEQLRPIQARAVELMHGTET